MARHAFVSIPVVAVHPAVQRHRNRIQYGRFACARGAGNGKKVAPIERRTVETNLMHTFQRIKVLEFDADDFHKATNSRFFINEKQK